jgi:hypothetical protein
MKQEYFDQLENGEPWYIDGTELHACCECGCVHLIRLGRDEQGLYVQFWRDPMETRKLRAKLERRRLRTRNNKS